MRPPVTQRPRAVTFGPEVSGRIACLGYGGNAGWIARARSKAHPGERTASPPRNISKLTAGPRTRPADGHQIFAKQRKVPQNGILERPLWAALIGEMAQLEHLDGQARPRQHLEQRVRRKPIAMIGVDPLLTAQRGKQITGPKGIGHGHDEPIDSVAVVRHDRRQEIDRIVDVLEHLAEQDVVPVTGQDRRDAGIGGKIAVEHVIDAELRPRYRDALGVDVDADAALREARQTRVQPGPAVDLLCEQRQMIDAADVDHVCATHERFDHLEPVPGARMLNDIGFQQF